MFSKVRFLLGSVILLLFVSCKPQKELTTEYLIGKWEQYDGTKTENGATINDFLPATAIEYEFVKNGTINVGVKIEKKMAWKIEEPNKLLIGLDEKFAEYKGEIKSDTIMILSREYKGNTFSYHFKKEQSE